MCFSGKCPYEHYFGGCNIQNGSPTMPQMVFPADALCCLPETTEKEQENDKK